MSGTIKAGKIRLKRKIENMKKEKQTFQIENRKYPCNLEVCKLCNCDKGEPWFIYKSNKYCPDCFIEIRKKELIEKIMNLINKERNNGNIAPHEFSPAICLSNLIKFLEEKK